MTWQFASYGVRSIVKRTRWQALSWLLVAAVGCGSTPPVVSKPLPSPVVSVKKDSLDPEIFKQVTGAADGDAYRVGAGDSLLVAVYGHPELAISTYAGTTTSGTRVPGFQVDNDGSIQFPLIGYMQVAGKTTNELRVFLETRLTEFWHDPKVTVQVAFHGSIRYYLLGEFTTPGLKYSDRPLRLMEALTLGGSVVLQRASLHSAYIARNGKRLPIDFQRLVRDGDLKHNIPLRTGDVVVIPDNSSEQAYVFGGVTGNDGGGGVARGVVRFVNGRLDILQALSQAGFGFQERSEGILSDTHVIRSAGDQGTLFVVDVERILSGDAATFHLAPGDIIFVPTTWVTDWNNALRRLLPTLQAISGLLSPFVQIKYLSQD
jgi:polysaccharide export outer membrane protein